MSCFWKHFCSHSDKHNGCLNKPELAVKASDRRATNNIQVNNDSLPFFSPLTWVRIFQFNIFTVYTKVLFLGWYIQRFINYSYTYIITPNGFALILNGCFQSLSKQQQKPHHKEQIPPWTPLGLLRNANEPSLNRQILHTKGMPDYKNWIVIGEITP